MKRLDQLNGQFSGVESRAPFLSDENITLDGRSYPEIIDHAPDREIKYFYTKLQGWGYRDSGFEYDKQKKMIQIKGNRYMFGGQFLPKFGEYIKNNMFSDLESNDPCQEDMEITEPKLNHEFVEELGHELLSRRSFSKWERIMHSHGACLEEVWQLRYEKIPKLCDMVIYPDSTEQTERLVKLAVKHDVVLVPYGGGTNVTKSLQYPMEETRMIVSVDMGRMASIKWVDKENNLACVGAGIMGQDLERQLNKYGVCTGHEPDSSEYSTMGGWVSTRASGMKKNTYGNIEDIVLNCTYVTPTGIFTRTHPWARVSNGPDMQQMIMGSEGNYGIVTDVTVRVRPVPHTKIYESMIFKDYEIGIRFMHAVSKTSSANWPTSIRLVDNTQFQMGASLKPEDHSKWNEFIEAAKKFFVVKIKGFDPNEMSAVTMLFEGDEAWARSSHKAITDMGKQFGGMVGGPENGMRGYLLTFLIAYTRDLAMEHFTLGESFELSCPWSNVSEIQKKVKTRMYAAAEQVGFGKDRVWLSFRVTQLYETGAAIYVYLTMYHKGIDRSTVIDAYEYVEDAARDEVMLQGGSISHHHGVGKIRKKFIERTMSPNAIAWQKSLKEHIDPTNIFAINNTIARTEAETNALRAESDQKFTKRIPILGTGNHN